MRDVLAEQNIGKFEDIARWVPGLKPSRSVWPSDSTYYLFEVSILNSLDAGSDGGER